MTAHQICPSGHKNSEGQRFCFSCGWFFPAAVHTLLQSYRVLQSRFLLKGTKYLYQVEKDGQIYTLSENIEFLPHALRQQVHASIEKLLEQTDSPLVEYFHGIAQSIPLLYSVYGPEYWNAEPLRVKLDQAGLLSASEIAAIIRQTGKWQEALREEKLLCPGWILPCLSLDSESQLFFLNWESCLPSDYDEIYPHFYLGYHTGAQVQARNKASDFNRELQNRAFSATLIELLCGKSAAFWYPQSPTLKPWRSAYQREFLQLLDPAHALNFHQVSENRIFRSEEIQSALTQANQLFWKGYTLYQDQKRAEAIPYFSEAGKIYLNDPFSPFFEALCWSPEDPVRAMNAFEQALKISPLSAILKERAHFLHERGQWEQAIKDLRNAVRQTPYFPEAWFLMGRLSHLFEQANEAEHAYLNAWNQRHDRAWAKEIARFYFQQGLPETAAQFQSYQTLGQGAVLEFNDNLGQITKKQNIAQTLERQHIQDYLLEELIRKPSLPDYKFSTIYKGSKQNQSYLIKQFDLSSPPVAGVFEREAKMMSQLGHDHIQSLHAAFREDGFGWLIYEYFPGKTLQDIISEEGLIDEALAWQILITLGSVIVYLQALPQSIIHGDIKPANILITPDQHVYLLDFESAAYARESDGLVLHATALSPPYCPAEQLYHMRMTLSTDPYALGVTLMHAVTGVFPDMFENFAKQRWQFWEKYALHIQHNLRQIITQLTLWEPNDRLPLTHQTLRKWLEQFRATQSLPLPHESQNKAKALNLIHQFDQYSEHMETAIERYLGMERSALSLFYVASQLQRVGKKEKAFYFARQAAQIAPRFTQASWLLAELLMEEKPEQAIDLLNQSLEFCTSHFYTYQLLGRAYQRVSKFQLAIASFLQAEKRDHLADLEHELIFLYAHQGFYQEARKRIQKILPSALLPQDTRARLLLILGAIYGEQGYLKESAHQLEKVIALDPELDQAVFDLGLSYFRLERYPEAEKYLRQFLNKAPQNPQAQLLLAKALIEQKKADEAVTLLKHLSAKKFKLAEVYFQLGRSLTILNQVPAALAAYEQALALQPSLPIWINLGNLYWLINQPQKAVEYYRLAHRQAPQHPLVRKAWQTLEEKYPELAQSV